MEVPCSAARVGAGHQHRRAGLSTSLYSSLIKKETMQGGCSSSTSSLLSLLAGLASSTACAARAMQPGRIGTLRVTIGVVCLTMSSLVMQQGCLVVSTIETIAILLSVTALCTIHAHQRAKYCKELVEIGQERSIWCSMDPILGCWPCNLLFERLHLSQALKTKD